MEKILIPEKKLQTQTDKVHRVSRRVIILCITAVVTVSIACVHPWINPEMRDTDENYYGKSSIDTITNPENSEPMAEVLEPVTPKQAAPQPKPTNQPAALPESVPNTVGTNAYTVSAQDFSCICQVDGNVNVELRVNGDQLEIIDPGGNAQVYDKIGENTYKRSWMGYYILVEDGQETQVDEEKSVVVILTDTGYIMEHYSGSEGSPCCIHTFLQTE